MLFFLPLSQVPPSGGSLEIGNTSLLIGSVYTLGCSPFGGIPRNWKLERGEAPGVVHLGKVPPSGGSLEIGNVKDEHSLVLQKK